VMGAGGFRRRRLVRVADGGDNRGADAGSKDGRVTHGTGAAGYQNHRGVATGSALTLDRWSQGAGRLVLLVLHA